MDNLALEIIDEEIHDEFIINNDALAEWALKKIAEETADAQRYINVCDTMIAEYTFKKQKEQERLDNKTGYLKFKLQEYFNAVEHHKTETKETYKLPSGTLVKKYGTPEYTVDEKALAEFLKGNGMKDYYSEVVKPKWGELKKVVTVSGDKVLTADGEVIDGVKVNDRPDLFEVKL